jgi:hypothetical protein
MAWSDERRGSLSQQGSGPYRISGGYGAYTGIKGTGTATLHGTIETARNANGTCNTNDISGRLLLFAAQEAIRRGEGRHPRPAKLPTRPIVRSNRGDRKVPEASALPPCRPAHNQGPEGSRWGASSPAPRAIPAIECHACRAQFMLKVTKAWRRS